MPIASRRTLAHLCFLAAVLGVLVSVFVTQVYEGFSFDPPNRSELHHEAVADALGIALLAASVLPMRMLRLHRGPVITVGVLAALLALDAARILYLAEHPSSSPVVGRSATAQVFFVLPTTWPMLWLVVFTIVQAVVSGRSRLARR